MFYKKRVQLIHLIPVAIRALFLTTSKTTFEEWRVSGRFFILFFQFDLPIFSIEINFKRKGQEIKIEHTNGLGPEYVHTLGQLFYKISRNYA